ncbi:hypothetical protein AAFN47_27490 [Hoeflea sp. CAU 1731]
MVERPDRIPLHVAAMAAELRGRRTDLTGMTTEEKWRHFARKMGTFYAPLDPVAARRAETLLLKRMLAK